jgi:hypothetical protein
MCEYVSLRCSLAMKWVRTLSRCSSWLGNYVQITDKEKTLYFSSKTPTLPCLVNGGKWVEIRVSAPPWSVCLKILKRDLMETMESR